MKRKAGNMKDIGIITGSENQAQPLIVGTDTVYVHTDIKPVTKDAEGKDVKDLFKYHEVQYEKDEYIKKMSEANIQLQAQAESIQEALDFLISSTSGASDNTTTA